MSASQVRERPGRVTRGGGPAFDLVVSKLRCPAPRPGTVRRSSLVERLARDNPCPVVSVVASAGYGKTTLLSLWGERDSRSFAWVSVDDRDNDPKVLLAYIAVALDRVEPIGGRVFDALASPTSSVPGSVVPRLAAAFAAMTSPVVLVLDDVHLLHNPECRSALSVLAEHVPRGSQLVLAGRDAPPLRIARLRAEGRITEVGAADLTLTREEAAALLRAAEVRVGDEDVAALHERTEGWPVGLYLAALYLREGGSVGTAAVSFGGDDRLVSEYLESEFLDRISGPHRTFLTRSAALMRMSGALCEAVLELPGAAATLADLARSNLLLVPLDRRGKWYRYHHLFRDMLLAQLERLEPGRAPVLRRHAATWCLDSNRPEEALEYSLAAGDVDAVARLIRDLWLPVYWQGRYTTLSRWFHWLDERGGIEAHPPVAVQAALVAAHTGRPAEADRWADVIDRWQWDEAAQAADPVTAAWAALAQAILCRHGVEQMRADADGAARRFTAQNIVAPGAQLCQGLARIFAGDLDDGDAKLDEAARLAKKSGAPEAVALALSERALLAITRGDWRQAEDLAEQTSAALSQAGMEHLLACAVQARVAMRRGNVAAARRELINAQRLRPMVTYAHPYLAVQTRIELARVHLALAEPSGARTLMQEIGEILKQRPDLGTLLGQVKQLQARLGKEHGPMMSGGASALTTAELRLLPILCTHLTVPEIAAELFLSPHTIKAQIKSIYRKLEATNRHQAVARARELELIDS
jgi:LuxR family transcriptional regulator, maltose regulon positive regulatory protein